MIEITDAAKAELKRILSENSQDSSELLRLTAGPEGSLGLIIDKATEGDNIFEHEGIRVLAIEAELAGMMHGVSMDVEDTDEGPMLTFKGDCGCGCGDNERGHGSCCGGEGSCH